MVEEDVVNGKSGKGIEHRADEGGVRGLGIPVNVDVPRKGGTGKFQNQQGAHQKLDPFRGKGNGQPEEGTSQQIETVGAHKIGPQIREMAPSQVAGANRIVGQPVEGDLLHIEVPIEEKPSSIYHHKGEKDQKRQAQSQEKGFEEIIVPPALFSIIAICHKSVYLLIVFQRENGEMGPPGKAKHRTSCPFPDIIP